MNNGSKDFPRVLVTALRAQGITFIGTTWLPGTDGSFTNGERGYSLDDNGTMRIRTYLDIKRMASV